MFCIDNLYFNMVWSSLEFEWDENKNRVNLKKHKIDFSEAQFVFADPFYKEFYDVKHSVSEDRWKVMGYVGKLLLSVIVTYRKDNVIRIISARDATPTERNEYYGNG